MSIILGLDFGLKRCGLAATDSSQLIASALKTVPSKELMDTFADLIESNNVEILVVGQPMRKGGELSSIEQNILLFISAFQKKFPEIKVERQEESFTSVQAVQSMIQAGHGKMKRRKKENVDVVSATLILQRYLENRRQNQNG